MNFASVDFLIFLVITFCIYFSLPDRYRNAFLLLASYFFYAYWSVKYLVLLVFTMVLDYWIAILIQDSANQRKKKLFLILSLIANLGILFLFKYFNLFSDLLFTLLHKPGVSLDLILPFGISFYTFHAMSYTIDVYRGVITAERNFTYYSGYVMFFPQLVAGPIARASHLLHQFAEPKRIRFGNFVDGSWLILKGYILKVVLADNLAPVVDAYFGTELTRTPLIVLQGVYFFAFQIYFDFAGYSDIARGVAKLFDFDLVINFRRPYSATSITDFWRRWHISLSTWLRDYLYISLGGNRFGELRTYRNLMLTMLLGGLWHGANWTFLAWGALHGTYLVCERFFGNKNLGLWLGKLPKVFKIIFTFHLVCFAWIFFRAESFRQAYEIIHEICLISRDNFKLSQINVGVWKLIAAFMIFEWAEEKFALFEKYKRSPLALRYGIVYAAIVIVVLFAQLDPKAFIYFQF